MSMEQGSGGGPRLFREQTIMNAQLAAPHLAVGLCVIFLLVQALRSPSAINIISY